MRAREGAGRMAVLCYAIGAAILLGLALCSCSGPHGYAVRGEVYVRDPESGAKAGLSVGDGEATVSGRVYDEEGNLVAGGNVSFPVIRPEK